MELALFSVFSLQIILFSALFAILIDLLMGDPNWKYHPVMLIGNTLSFLEKKLRVNHPIRGRINGVILVLIVILLFAIPSILLPIGIWRLWGFWADSNSYQPSWVDLVLIGLIFGFILKWSFAIKNLGDVVKPIQAALEKNDLPEARKKLSWIVRRNTTTLDPEHIISASVEVVAESSTDSVNSVFFFYFIGAILGRLLYLIQFNVFWLFIAFGCAYMFRVINTGDSVVGYKDPDHIYIGWCAARSDTYTNYLPSRLTAYLMIIVGKVMRLDAQNGMRILKRDHNSLTSLNAGWTMGTMAGLLNVQLEKIGSYKLGDPTRPLQPQDIRTTYLLIRRTMLLFTAIFAFLYVCVEFQSN
jgi:adenosylcobinamide-phosphate synthase